MLTGTLTQTSVRIFTSACRRRKLSSDAAAFIERELADPTDLDAIIASARTEEQKVELYTAVRLTIEPDTRAERGFLDLVAGRLGLPDALLDHIDSTVAGAKVAV